MKSLPKPLRRSLSIIAQCEARRIGRNPQEIYDEFEKELIDESLVAKANPSRASGRNPRLSRGMKPSQFNRRELARGTKVEMEHTDSLRVAQRIAMDHLVEDKGYYKKLKKMERK